MCVCVFACRSCKALLLQAQRARRLHSWSRSRKGISRTSSKALVLEVHREPSNTVRNLPKVSPSDLHYFSFWVGTSGGVLDLLAYNEDAYNVWLLELERVAGKNANLSRSTVQGFKEAPSTADPSPASVPRVRQLEFL